MEELGRAYGVSVFAILRRLISAETVLEVSRHIVIPAGRVVLEYSIDPGRARVQHRRRRAGGGRFNEDAAGAGHDDGRDRSATGGYRQLRDHQRADRHRQPIGPVPTPNSTAHGAPAAGAPWTACVLAA